MNAKTRKELSEIRDILQEQLDQLEGYRDDESAKYDNLPEGLQSSERGEAMQEAAETLDSACDSLQEAIESLGEIL